jgi:hypothetical protein
MIGFWQTDKKLLPKIQTFGCALLDCMYLTNDNFTQDDVNNMYKALLNVNFIDEDCTILSWQNVLWSISPYFAFKKKVGKTYVCEVNERDIIKWYLGSINENHFTCGDGAGKTTWDSMNRPDVMALPTTTFVERVIVRVF